MNKLQQHWFNILIALILFFSICFFTIIAFSPRVDAQKRGFIPCTEALSEQIENCNTQIFCSLKAILKNSWCDAKVIGQGMKDWLKGTQPTPWSNYMFIPELYDTTDDEFYQENPDYIQDFTQTKKQGIQLEQTISDTLKAEEDNNEK